MANDLMVVLARNVERLMQESGDSQASAAARGGLSQRSVGNVLTYGKTHHTAPTLRTVEGLAKAFSVPAWMLFIPGLPADMVGDTSAVQLLKAFAQVPADARANILRIADGEVRYAGIQRSGSRKTGS